VVAAVVPQVVLVSVELQAEEEQEDVLEEAVVLLP
jgi:hypothetical protein